MSESPQPFQLPKSLAESVAYHLDPEFTQYYTGNLMGNLLGIAAELFQYPKFRDAEVIAQLLECYYNALAPYLDWQERYLTAACGSQRLLQKIEQKRTWRKTQQQCRELTPKLDESQRRLQAVQQKLNREIRLFSRLLSDNTNQMFTALLTDYAAGLRNSFQNTSENAYEMDKLVRLLGDLIYYRVLSYLLVDTDHALEKQYDAKGNTESHPAKSARHQNR